MWNFDTEYLFQLAYEGSPRRGVLDDVDTHGIWFTAHLSGESYSTVSTFYPWHVLQWAVVSTN